MALSNLAEYPFAPRFISKDGHNLAYVDEGQGPVVVMLHGNPSWSYLYRNLVRALRPEYRCIVPDHMGCGNSDKPQDYSYRLDQHIANLEHLLDTLGVERCHLIVHDWGGAIGMGWAGRRPRQVERLVVLNTAAFRSRLLPWRIAICRWPLLGSLLVRGMNGFARAAVHMAVTKPMRPEIATGFLAPYHDWASRIALHRFVADIPMAPTHPSYAALVSVEDALIQLRRQPMLICWGGRDFCFTKHFFDEWRRRFPEAEAQYLAQAGHYLLEDAFDDILPLLKRFLAGTEHPA